MEIIEERTSEYLLAAALRAADKKSPMLVPAVRYELINWCGLVTDELRERQAAIVAIPTVVDFPKERRKVPPAYLAEAGRKDHVSTPELRRHAFAVYAAAMAYHGSEEAFEAAVWETLRRARNWTEAAAAEHTRRFIVSAYERAFPPKR